MSTTAVERIPLAQSVSFGASEMLVNLVDGRRVSVPLEWFPKLAKATPTQLENYERWGMVKVSTGPIWTKT